MSEHGRRDAALVSAARDGSEAALEALFRRYWAVARHSAFLVCHDHAAAEDIAQEAFVAAVRSLGRFDRRRPFGPWLHRIVVNRAIDWTRVRAARREAPVDGMHELGAGETAGLDSSELERLGDLDELLAALAELSPEHRAVIVLRYLHDFSPGEISRALSLPRGTVNSRLRRGLDSLGRHLERVP